MSISDSPLTVAEVLILRLSISADRRCAASSKVERVRVLASKNRLATVLPRRIGTFLICDRSPRKGLGGIEDFGQDVLVQSLGTEKMAQTTIFVELNVVSQHWPPVVLFPVLAPVRLPPSSLIWLSLSSSMVARRNVGLDRNFAFAAVNQDRQQYLSGSTVVKNFVHRGADGATRLQHVIDQHNHLVVYVGWQVGWFYGWVQTNAGEIIAIKGNVELTQLSGRLQSFVQAFGNPYPTSLNTDNERFRLVALKIGVRASASWSIRESTEGRFTVAPYVIGALYITLVGKRTLPGFTIWRSRCQP